MTTHTIEIQRINFNGRVDFVNKQVCGIIEFAKDYAEDEANRYVARLDEQWSDQGFEPIGQFFGRNVGITGLQEYYYENCWTGDKRCIRIEINNN